MTNEKRPNLQILGDGSFGTFLKEFLSQSFNIVPAKERDHCFNNTAYKQLFDYKKLFSKNDFFCPIILAVPISALHEVASNYKDRHIINVCSTQKNSNSILANINPNNYTGLHPLFGKRTPAEFRNSIFTKSSKSNRESEIEFLFNFRALSEVIMMDDIEHDKIMASTHVAVVKALEMIKPLLQSGKDIDDRLVPHSYRLLRDLSKTIEDMPSGTLSTILSNEFA